MIRVPDLILSETAALEDSLVSVGKTHSHRLAGMDHISPYQNLHSWLDMTPEKAVDRRLNLTALLDD